MTYKLDLKVFRKANSMTQEAASMYFDCNQSFISLIETGRSSPPDNFISKILADENIKKDGIESIDENLLLEPIEKYGINLFIDIMRKQADSLSKKDEQIDRLITLLENQLNKKI